MTNLSVLILLVFFQAIPVVIAKRVYFYSKFSKIPMVGTVITEGKQKVFVTLTNTSFTRIMVTEEMEKRIYEVQQ